MSINGKQDNFVADDLLKTEKIAGLNRAKCKTIINDVLAVSHEWRKFAKEANVEKRKIDSISNVFRLL